MASPVSRSRDRFPQTVYITVVAGVLGVAVGAFTVSVVSLGAVEKATAADKPDKGKRTNRGENPFRTGPVYTLAQLASELSLSEQQVRTLQPVDARVTAARVTLRETAAAEARKLHEAMEAALKERPDKDDKKSRITNQRTAIQSRLALLGADLAELEEEWLDMVASVCDDVQQQKLRSLRDPNRPTAPVTVRGPETPVEVLVEQLNRVELSAEQRAKLAPAIEDFRRGYGELTRQALNEVELLLTPDQRAANDKAVKDRRGALPPDYLLRNFESLRPAPTAEQRTKFAEIKTRADARFREVFSEFVLDLRDVLSPEQVQRLEKIRGPLTAPPLISGNTKK